MFMESGGKRRGTFVGGFLSRVRDGVARWNELQRLDAEEVAAIACELNLSSAELRALAFTSSRSVESLNKRLAHAGLSEDDLAASHGDVLRDLRRVCGQCSSKARCARDLSRERRAAPAKYCPNEQTLRSLADAASRSASHILTFPTLLS